MSKTFFPSRKFIATFFSFFFCACLFAYPVFRLNARKGLVRISVFDVLGGTFTFLLSGFSGFLWWETEMSAKKQEKETVEAPLQESK